MSAPAWASRTVLDGSNGVIYIQTAGTATAPGTADELGFVTGGEFSNEPEVTEKGPYVNLAQVKKTLASYSASGSLTIDVAAGADTVRNLFFTAITNKSRLKITIALGGTNGEKHVFDQSIVGVSGSLDPAEGTTYTFAFESDSYTHTAATA